MLVSCYFSIDFHHALDCEKFAADIEQNVVHVLHLIKDYSIALYVKGSKCMFLIGLLC